MGYVIVAGVGLAIGIGLLIWGLVERSKRADADKRAYTAEFALGNEKVKHEATRAWGNSLQATAKKQDAQIQELRRIIELTRARLVGSQDPRVIKTWIDEELRAKAL